MSKKNWKRLRKENEELKEMCAQKAMPAKDTVLEALQQMEEYLKRQKRERCSFHHNTLADNGLLRVLYERRFEQIN